LSVEIKMGDSHSVLGEGSCLIGADARGGSEGLDGLKVLNEHHLSSHSLSGQSKGDSHGSEKSLWHVGDNDTNGEDQVGDDVVLVDDTEDEENDTERHGDTRDDLDESLDLNGEWGLGRLGGRGQVSNLSDNGSVSCSETDTSTRSSSALGTEEGDVLGLENVVYGFKIWVNLDIFGLTGEGSVIDFHLVRFENADIAWNVFTTLDEDNITWNDELGVDLGFLAVSNDVGNWWDEVLELSHHLGRFG